MSPEYKSKGIGNHWLARKAEREIIEKAYQDIREEIGTEWGLESDETLVALAAKIFKELEAWSDLEK